MDEAANGNGAGLTLTATLPGDYPGFQKPEWHTLPSGARFLLRRPQVSRMMRMGEIPNPLMDVLEDLFTEQDKAEEETLAAEAGQTVEEYREKEADADTDEPPARPAASVSRETINGMKYMDVLVWASVVEPRIEFEPQASPDTPMTASGALSFDALAEPDYQYILKFANGEVAEAATFPAESERTDDLGGGGAVRDDAELVAGHPA